jgi:simple sugar transport system ATP-binding protein
VTDLCVRGRRGHQAVAKLSLALRAGEILGVAGVEGNGQTELLGAIAGLCPVAAGTIALGGVDVTHASVAERQRRGLGHVPEDRQERGLVLDFSIEDNFALGRQRELGRGPLLDRAALSVLARREGESLALAAADPAAPARHLSGGNQQKIVVARELSRPGLTVLLCAQPTRGVDIGASEAIRRRLLAARDAGVAVLLVSADLGEIRQLADRVAVLARGRVVDLLDGAALAGDADAVLDRLGEGMTGARRAP